jgi:hypothetical protein
VEAVAFRPLKKIAEKERALASGFHFLPHEHW